MSARTLSLILAAALAAAPSAAFACGGFFAQSVEVSPEQTILVSFRSGVETYVLRPHFCGEAKDFGVILPIPTALVSAPALADDAIYGDLESYTAPEVVEVCKPSSPAMGCGGTRSVGAMPPDAIDGGARPVNVVDRGRVGAFEYVLLQATTANAFTDWLDQNGFPHGTSTAAYDGYVAKQWYFVAFKVSADTGAPPAGMKLCGDLGPIQLSFNAAEPVVPARIAQVNSSTGAKWRVALVAADPMQLRPQQLSGTSMALTGERYFAGAVDPAAMSAQPALAGFVREGERLTVLDVRFPYGAGPADDLIFERSSDASDFRTVKNVPKDCTFGCVSGGVGASQMVAAIALLGAFAGLKRRRVR